MCEIGISRRNGGGGGGSFTYNVCEMVLYTNENSFSVLLDVYAICLFDIHGTSR